jgi:hypothetical protein
MGTMGFFSASLGLNCTDCHVDESGGNWAKYADDNSLKQTTRRMIRMVTAINQTSFGGRQLVTCNTCHRGTRQPNVMPSLALLYGAPPPDEPGDPFQQAPGQPTADQVLDKFVAAVGGAQRLSALSGIVARGSFNEAQWSIRCRATARRRTTGARVGLPRQKPKSPSRSSQ